MIYQFYQIITSLVLCFLSISSFAKNTSSAQCRQSCGNHTVAYPFGFSNGCGIKLNCSGNSDGIGKIGGFLVKNVTSDQISISIPADCNRSSAEFARLFSDNFAPTLHNGLLFTGCESTVNDFVIPEPLLSYGFENKTCDRKNLSCYSQDDGKEFFDYTSVTQRGNCSNWFSSVRADFFGSGNTTNRSSFLSLDFEMIELGWWVNGGCHCNPNATCNKVTRGGKSGFRCKCNEGYSGDGFINGTGCIKVSIQCGETRVGILVGVVIGGVSTVTVLVAICVCLKRRSSSLKSRSFAMHLLSEAAGKSHVPFYPYKEIERATNSFSENKRLGTGAYGTVYAGKFQNDEWVAIKKIKHQDRDSIDQVINEINLISSVSHPNLIRLLGFCIQKGEQILIYEYMPNGTLSQHLQRERGSVLPWTVRLTIATETAHAIAHLHSALNPPIYHRDIKSSNILLDYSFKSKVADFGLSRLGMMDDSHISTAPQGTPGYLDPQYHQNFHLSDKSDVYSFGVVLVEIITAKKVVDFSRPHSEINLAALAIDKIGKGCIDDIIDPFLEPNRDAWTLSSMHKVAELAFRCLAFHKDMRPSMMEVADELEQIRLSSWSPLEENICMGSSVASSCSSSPYLGSQKSMTTFTTKKVVAGDHSSSFPARIVAEKAKDSSPVSVQDPWLSEECSPPTNALLGKETL
ncbi:hypothetical protein ACS0TY_028646 [Phlomoides rotata]